MSSSQEINNARFNEEALIWDANKKHVDVVETAFEALQRYVPALKDGTSKKYDVLELGCGTGLLSFKLAPHVRSIVGIDTADGMINAFNAKLASLPDPSKPNLCAINHLLTSADSPALQGAAAALATQRGETSSPPYRFDLIVSHLTLHHIPSLPELFATLQDCLKHGGTIALSDFEDFGPEAKRFHPLKKRPGVERHGIQKENIEELLLGTGFNEVRVERLCAITKWAEAEDGKVAEDLEFPMLMCVGVKS
ncbi:S-adenosyl-L-methionine-dependent methyltransferase [Cucurbitaria berberidis CBS 394.84]|uniref:S-adenosyl-L-methionine-dependent methyltransferase n=1 Tax=Cucurbitaria berberidis CBS 394.84 TaxID=1168544 RepID=A0A9P4GK08_9PLEO|nr:S-adenosyl-L-methionine-dependent methyltransferase [Cucurbitaria berberidis CBS 394.84]KAF1846975.1 S-adenosyl-L-methionine-dependent methyltransferase [Cucurbitaria berberidis CBS 394.84]